jgi:hypothetical protein
MEAGALFLAAFAGGALTADFAAAFWGPAPCGKSPMASSKFPITSPRPREGNLVTHLGRFCAARTSPGISHPITERGNLRDCSRKPESAPEASLFEERVAAMLQTGEGYHAAAAAAVRALESQMREPRVGALTPVQAFGANFALLVPGTRIQEL